MTEIATKSWIKFLFSFCIFFDFLNFFFGNTKEWPYYCIKISRKFGSSISDRFHSNCHFFDRDLKLVVSGKTVVSSNVSKNFQIDRNKDLLNFSSVSVASFSPQITLITVTDVRFKIFVIKKGKNSVIFHCKFERKIFCFVMFNR